MIHKIVANIYLFFQLYFEDWPLGGTNKRVQKEFHKLLLDVPTCRYSIVLQENQDRVQGDFQS
jgi:hypothetical protein